MKLTIVGVTLSAVTVVLLPSGAGAVPKPHTWYVRAGAAGAGTGTYQQPFATLAAVAHASRPRDTIIVLPATAALDGGIALQRNQRLLGAGPAVTSLGADSAAPTLTNTSTSALDGDAVRLADGALVANLRISAARRGAVYGRDVTGVRVTGLDVLGQNASCTKGFLIPQFNAPTNVPGVGVPIPGGLQNGWAAIMVDASRRVGGTVRVDHTTIHDALCGDGIDVRANGTASYHVRIDHNDIRRLGQGPHLQSLLAIGLQASGRSTVTARVAHNTETDLGNRNDANLVQGADSEGIFVNGVDHGSLDIAVSDNTYTNPRHLGGFSANGLETVTMNDGARVRITVRDSTFTGSTGDVVEEGALGTNAHISMTLDHVVAQRSGPVGNTVALPFNNGDCVLAGSLGAGNDVALTVRSSVLRDCANNGLAVGSNVVNGAGPSARLTVDVEHTSITGNRGANLGIRNFTGLGELSVKVAHTDLRGNLGIGSAVAALSAEDLGSTTKATIDLGGGSLHSTGGSCISGLPLSADVVRYQVHARDDWWGQPGGPAALDTLVLAGVLDAADPLAAPDGCGAPKG